MTVTVELKAGQPAPDFDLPGADGPVRLKDLRGKLTVLYFYPKDDTSGCTAEAQAFTTAAQDFADAGAVVVGVSKDSVASHARFTAKYGLSPLLGSAKDDDIVERYGVWVEKSLYGRRYMGIERATFLIDAAGTIAQIWRKVKVAGHADAVLEAVRRLKRA
jgi:peroxiredoxin Q/BCP